MKRIPLRANLDDASSVIGHVELKDVHEQTLAEHMATFGRMGVTGRVTVNELRCRRKDLPVVEETKKTASVTVYEVVYGDDLTKEVYCQSFVGNDRLQSLRDNWKYVSVVSTKTVEVML